MNRANCFGTDIDPRVLHGTKVGRLNKNLSRNNLIPFKSLCIFSSYFYSEKFLNFLESLKDEKPDIWLNFKQYGFALPEVIRMDTSKQKLKTEGFFDSILCDPPYGNFLSVKLVRI